MCTCSSVIAGILFLKSLIDSHSALFLMIYLFLNKSLLNVLSRSVILVIRHISRIHCFELYLSNASFLKLKYCSFTTEEFMTPNVASKSSYYYSDKSLNTNFYRFKQETLGGTHYVCLI